MTYRAILVTEIAGRKLVFFADEGAVCVTPIPGSGTGAALVSADGPRSPIPAPLSRVTTALYDPELNGDGGERLPVRVDHPKSEAHNESGRRAWDTPARLHPHTMPSVSRLASRAIASSRVAKSAPRGATSVAQGP